MIKSLAIAGGVYSDPLSKHERAQPK